jgi:xanthine dehydrogenase YagS FAD-binding subunit
VQTFDLRRAHSVDDAVAIAGSARRREFIAGGTTMVDLMRLNVEHPAMLVDINHLDVDAVTRAADGSVRIGALARNADVARHPEITRDYAVLAQAILSGASPQLRNAASTGGNILQRTRCMYFRDAGAACNKRAPGSGCSALTGYNRNLAVLGTSEHCIATNPSDQNVALTVLDASLELRTAHAKRTVPFRNFYLLPGAHPERETVLAPGELIVAVTLPPKRPATRSYYLKLRDRASYEFALASTAVALDLNGGVMRNVRVSLGGVGTRPWAAIEAEHALEGRKPSAALFASAADATLRGAKPQSQNGFKIELAKRCISAALTHVTSERFA